ncbi:thiopurine S-methyltransferase [Amphritea sp. HPY]|uniref:thiopurine S-methyltransferase n=1 Tax=Amphritea sp. HPY TaxID=3421652 RepID=UPI003D7CD1AB
MKSEFWHERWESGRIGFHLEQVNPFLQRGWPALNTAGEGRVLVPLCGKSRDMLWLREQGHEVAGVELSDIACDAFFTEQALNVKSRSLGEFQVREVDGLELLCGDFFNLNHEQLDGLSWVYDRAALIAFPSEMRVRYARAMCEKLPAGVAMLLITLEFEEPQGPPFSVSQDEVSQLYGGRFMIEKIYSEQVEGKGGRMETETIYVLRDKT